MFRNSSCISGLFLYLRSISVYPLIDVNGVLKSWATMFKNSVFCLSISFSLLFALSSSLFSKFFFFFSNPQFFIDILYFFYRLFLLLSLNHCLDPSQTDPRSEEHTSELQSQSNLVCR